MKLIKVNLKKGDRVYAIQHDFIYDGNIDFDNEVVVEIEFKGKTQKYHGIVTGIEEVPEDINLKPILEVVA